MSCWDNRGPYARLPRPKGTLAWYWPQGGSCCILLSYLPEHWWTLERRYHVEGDWPREGWGCPGGAFPFWWPQPGRAGPEPSVLLEDSCLAINQLTCSEDRLPALALLINTATPAELKHQQSWAPGLLRSRWHCQEVVSCRPGTRAAGCCPRLRAPPSPGMATGLPHLVLWLVGTSENTTAPTQCPIDPTFSMASGSPMGSDVLLSCWLLKATVIQGQPCTQPKGAPSDRGAGAFASTGPRADGISWVLCSGHGARRAPLSAFYTAREAANRRLLSPGTPCRAQHEGTRTPRAPPGHH